MNKETITIIVGSILTLSGLVVAFNTINKFIKDKLNTMRDWLNEPTQKELNNLKEQFKMKDYHDCQKDILDFLNDVDNGINKTEVQIKYIKDLYTHYGKNLNGNTYVHDEWVRIMGGDN